MDEAVIPTALLFSPAQWSQYHAGTLVSLALTAYPSAMGSRGCPASVSVFSTVTGVSDLHQEPTKGATWPEWCEGLGSWRPLSHPVTT